MKTILLALSLVSVSAYSAPKPKVAVCHFSSDEGTFHLINIASPAVDAHLNHGDVLAPAAASTITVSLGDGVTVTLDSTCAAI